MSSAFWLVAGASVCTGASATGADSAADSTTGGAGVGVGVGVASATGVLTVPEPFCGAVAGAL